MRILFITHQRSRQNTGGSVYSAAVRSLLDRAFDDVTFDMVYAVVDDNRRKKLYRKLRSLGAFFFFGRPSKSFYFRTTRAARDIRALLGQHVYDLCIIEHAEMLWTRALLPSDLRVIHVSQNVEHEMYRQFVEQARVPSLMKRFLQADVAAYRDFELSHIRAIRNLVAISEADASRFATEMPETNRLVVPPVFDYPAFEYRPRACERIRLGILANMVWWPNRAGYEWLVEKVLDRIDVPCEVNVFGRASETLAVRHPLVKVHGYAESLREVWDSCDVMVNPVFEGGGLNIKVAEAVYNGMPILCSQFALRGIELPDRSENTVFVSDDPGEWAGHINDIVTKGAALEPQSESNRALFSLEHNVPPVKEYVEGVLEGSGTIQPDT